MSYVDKSDSGHEYIDLSDDSDISSSQMGRPQPPRVAAASACWVSIVTLTDHSAMSLQNHEDVMTRSLFHSRSLQVSVHPNMDDTPLLENLNWLLSIRIDPSDLRACTFGEHTSCRSRTNIRTVLVDITTEPSAFPITAQLIRALWEIVRSFFTRVPLLWYYM